MLVSMKLNCYPSNQNLKKKVCILKFEFECGGVLNDAMPLSCCSSYCTFDRGTTIAGIFGPIK